MKTVKIAAALAVGVTLFATAGCTSAQVIEPVADGTLNWGIEGANLTDGKMDPHSSQLDVTAYVTRQTLDSLVYMNETGEIVPWLASSWKVSTDGKSYTFTLRSDVTFSDGTAFNASAVKANFDHIMAESTESAQASSLLGGELYVATEVIDESTVLVRFSEPFAPFLANASTAYLGMYSPAVLASSADKLKAGGPNVTVGSGPFVMDELVANDHISYTRNPDYKWAPQGFKPTSKAIKSLNIEIVPEAQVRKKSVESGELDVATGLTPNVLESASDKITVTTTASPGLPYSLFLNQTNGVFADPHVREAFALGIDISAAVETVYFGKFDRAWSILTPTTPNSYDETLESQQKFDQAQADTLLDEAGWSKKNKDGYRTKDGKILEVTWYSWTPISEEHKNLAAFFADDLKKIGVKLTHKVVEPADYMEAYQSGSFDITDWDFVSADADILRSHLHSEGYQNASHVSDEKLDVMLEKAAAATDPAARADLYKQIQQWNAKNLALLPIYSASFITAQAPSAMKVKYDLFGWPIFIEAESSHTK